ncbi:MAG TPA: hypothetical protein VIO60_01490 [Rectinemataceae bacterium]
MEIAHLHRVARGLVLAIALAFSVAPRPLLAQDAGLDTNLDSLFGDEVVESPGTEARPSIVDPVQAALKSNSVRVGGSISGSVGPSFVWNDLWSGTSNILDPETRTLDASLRSTLYVDGRPNEDFRVHASVKTSWPFGQTVKNGTGGSPSSFFVPDVSVFELFADFNWKDRLFFRFGKSTVKWGVGYFWSPADVVNLQAIDIFDPEAQREGPLNFRVHLPLLGSQNNFYLYAIVDEDDPDFATSALAGRMELLLGGWELGLGGYWRPDTAERAMITLTGSLGDIDVFGEAMVSRGSSKTFVQSIGTSPPYAIDISEKAEHRSSFYASASAGALYSSPKDNFTTIAQYYYNGEGYARADRDALISDAKLAIASASMSSPASVPSIYTALANLAYGSGRHYAAISITKGEVLNEDLSLSLLAIANLSDGSGLVRPSLGWKPMDYLSLSLSPTFVFGSDDAEYTFLAGGPKVNFSLSVTVSGAF